MVSGSPALIMSRLPPSPHCDNQLTGSALSAGSVAGTPGIRLPSLSALAGIPLLSGSGSGATSTVLASSAATPPVITVTPAGMAVPSLATLLSTPIGSTLGAMAVCPTAPLVISPALPSIPGKIIEKIQKGLFVDFKEFLNDNILLLQKLQDIGQANPALSAAQPFLSGSKLRDVPNPLSWASCFLAFLAAKTNCEEARELAAYGMIVLHLARKHGGSGWLLYDRQFRQQRAAGATMPWSEINPSLMAATVLSNSGGLQPRSCPHCLSPDHSKEECALASLEGPSNSAPVGSLQGPSRQSRRPWPYKPPDNICRRFNKSGCESAECRYDHICSGCHKPGHPIANCRSKGKGRPGDYTPSPKGNPAQSAK